MPDEMAVTKPFVCEKNKAGGIGDAARQQPDHRLRRNDDNEGTKRNQNEPSHSEVENDGELFQTDASPQLDRHSDNRQEPNKRENGPAKRAAHWSQHKRRIGARDEEEDRRVIDDLKDTFQPGLRPGVIKSRAEIEEPHRG